MVAILAFSTPCDVTISHLPFSSPFIVYIISPILEPASNGALILSEIFISSSREDSPVLGMRKLFHL